MITILGSQISFFALYAIVSLQLIVVFGAIFGWRLRNVKDDKGVPLLWLIVVVSEFILLAWLGSK